MAAGQETGIKTPDQVMREFGSRVFAEYDYFTLWELAIAEAVKTGWVDHTEQVVFPKVTATEVK